MENKVKLLIELGLQRDEDQGDVAVVAFDLPRSVAERVCREQESCQLLSECGDLTSLLNAYAVMNGYQCAWFISAEMQDDSADALIEENAELRESVLFLQTELEAADAERADAVKKAIYRMRDELKAGRIHFDGISLKAIPFDSVDAVAKMIIAVMIFIVAGIACIVKMPGVAIISCLVGSGVMVSAVTIYKINKQQKEHIKQLKKIADLIERNTPGGNSDGTKE